MSELYAYNMITARKSYNKSMIFGEHGIQYKIGILYLLMVKLKDYYKIGSFRYY